MFYKANHECVRPSMTLQVIHFGLLNVANISYAQVRLLDREIKREKLAERWLVVQGGEADVLSEILGDRHPVIRLSIFG